ncbi:MAG: hypothetical protein WC783_00970 [Candidatus Paceibacterota bacterium]|jgi:hypothetical protein
MYKNSDFISAEKPIDRNISIKLNKLQRFSNKINKLNDLYNSADDLLRESINPDNIDDVFSRRELSKIWELLQKIDKNSISIAGLIYDLEIKLSEVEDRILGD